MTKLSLYYLTLQLSRLIVSVKFFEDAVSSYTEKEFIVHFRIKRDLYQILSAEYEECEIFKEINKHSNVISADKSLVLFLLFAGHEVAFFEIVHTILKPN